MTLLIKEILKLKPENQLVTAEGWVKNFRANKFISLNDGSTIQNIQCVIDFENFDDSIIKKINTGASLLIKGKLVKSAQVFGTTQVDLSNLPSGTYQLILHGEAEVRSGRVVKI